MNCDNCVKINPLPECIESEVYNPYYLEGMTFTDADTDMVAKIQNLATRKMDYVYFTTEPDGYAYIDITNLFPLMDHPYEIRFTNKETGNPEDFTITNADGTESTGCCLQFTVNIGQTDNNEYFMVSTQGCVV